MNLSMSFGNTYSTEKTMITGYSHVKAELNYRYFHLHCQNEPSPKISTTKIMCFLKDNRVAIVYILLNLSGS